MPTTSPENNLELIIGAVLGSRKSSLILLDSESAALRIIGEDETELKTVNNSCDDIEAVTMGNERSLPHNRSDSWKVYIVQLIPIVLIRPIKILMSYIFVIYLWWLLTPSVGRGFGYLYRCICESDHFSVDRSFIQMGLTGSL